MTSLVSTYELLEQYRTDLDSGLWQLSRNIKNMIKISVENIHGAELKAGSISLAHIPYNLIRKNSSRVYIHQAMCYINYHGIRFNAIIDTQYNGKIKEWEIKCTDTRHRNYNIYMHDIRQIAVRHSIKLRDKFNHQLRQAGKIPQPVYYQLVKNESC